MTRTPLLIATLVLSLLVLTGCHQRAGQRVDPHERLPLEPGDKPKPFHDDPAGIDAKPWVAPKLPHDRTSDWQIAIVHLPGMESKLTYRLPYEWNRPDDRGRARSADGLVRAEVVVTPLTDEDLSIEAYAEQLAEDQPIFTRTDAHGHTSYLTTREVSVAPSDPNVARRMYHTGVVRVEDRIVKLEVSYDASVRWRFGDVASAIIGTIEVTEPDDV